MFLPHLLNKDLVPALTFQRWKLTGIKQFVVTNCSKERPGSIVTGTLKNGILIPIATSKELHFNADFKYISLVKRGRPWGLLLPQRPALYAKL